MKKIKLLSLSLASLSLIFLGGSQFRPTTVNAYSSFSIENNTRSEINWQLRSDSKMASSDIDAITKGVTKAIDTYDNEKRREIDSIVKAAVEKAIYEHEARKHR